MTPLERAPSRLERELLLLEGMFPLGHHYVQELRGVIAELRALESFNELILAREIEKARTRAEFAIEDIHLLASRLKQQGGP